MHLQQASQPSRLPLEEGGRKSTPWHSLWGRELGQGTGGQGTRGSKLGTGNLGQGGGDRELGAGNWDRDLEAANWATDRCCVSFGIAESEVRTVTDTLASIYACLSQEIACSTQQDLQRVIPLFWNMRLGDAPTFYRFRTATFLDVRSCTQEERWQLQSILIDMNIPYYIQKRLLLVIYAKGAELENFRLRTFQEQIKIPLAKKKAVYNALSLLESAKTIGRLILALLEVTLMKPFKLKMMDRS